MKVSVISYPRALPVGDSGVSIEFGDEIDVHLSEKVIALDAAITASRQQGLIETVPTYRSLLIHYDPLTTTYDHIAEVALALVKNLGSQTLIGRLLRIPVCYEGDFGVDIPQVASALKITSDELIARHTAPEYRVYMLGFQPGFAYLGGLDSKLSLPRRPSPRHGAPPGTISIAAAQCAVHAVEGPSGWHWIGRTPMPTYEDGEPPVFAIKPGDRIRFFAITADEWRCMRRAVLDGKTVIESI